MLPPLPPSNEYQNMLPPTFESYDTSPPWYDLGRWTPAAWTTDCCWESTFEVGVNGAEGNAQSFTMRTGGSVKRTSDWNTLKMDARYAKSAAGDTEQQHNALMNINSDWDLGDSPFKAFGKYALEYDEFKAFDLRWVVNAGFAYDVIKGDDCNLTGRFGAGISREIGGPDDRYVPEALFGMDYEKQITKRQKLRIKVDYFPEWGDFVNYRMVTDAGWELAFDDESHFSLKLGLIDRYDSTPNGRKANDIDYSVLLLWKM